MLTLPEEDHPDLPGEWWPHTVALLTIVSACRTPKTKVPVSAGYPGKRGNRPSGRSPPVECASDAHSEPTANGEIRAGTGTTAIHSRPAQGLFPVQIVAAAGHTRRSAGSCWGGGSGENLTHDIETSQHTKLPVNTDNSKRPSKTGIKTNLMKRVRFDMPETSPKPMKKSGKSKSNNTYVKGSLPDIGTSLHANVDSESSTRVSPKTNDLPHQTNEEQGSEETADHPSPDTGSKDNAFHNYDRLFDELYTRIRTDLQYDSESSTADKRTQLNLTEDNDLFWKGNRLYIPKGIDNLREDLVYWHHDVPWCAHLGIEKTINLIKHQFWWPGMDNDISKYIETCSTCQGNKPDRSSKKLPLVPLTPPDACWQTLGVDLIVDLPTTVDGYNTICVFVCHLSKMVRLVATDTSLDTTKFAKLFFKEVFPHYGMPRKIISDRGSQWNSEFFSALCNTAGVQLRLSTAHHPQTNGLVERTNEVVETALRHYVSSGHDDWADYLPLVEFALNNSYHKALGGTPFQLNRITLPRNPFDVLVQNKSDYGNITTAARWMGMSQIPKENGQRTMVQAYSQFDWAKKCVHLAKSRMKEQHDKNVKARHLYAVGDKVWFSLKYIKLKHPSLRGKFVPRFLGPITVLETVGPNSLKLDFPVGMGIHNTVSSSLVKPFRGRWNNQYPPVNIQGIEEFEVDSILSHNVLKSKRKNGLNLVEFLIRWKGGYEDSWEEFDSFTHSTDILNKYLSTSCNKSVRTSMYSVLTPEQRECLSSALSAEATSYLKTLKKSKDTSGENL